MEDISSVLNLMIINASDTLPGCRVRYFNPIPLGLKGLEGNEISSTCTKKVVMSQHEISQLLVAFKSVWIPLKRMWCRWIWSCLLYGCHAGTFLLSQRSILLAFLREGAPFLYGENRPTTYELSWVAMSLQGLRNPIIFHPFSQALEILEVDRVKSWEIPLLVPSWCWMPRKFCRMRVAQWNSFGSVNGKQQNLLPWMSRWQRAACWVFLWGAHRVEGGWKMDR